MLNIDFPLKNSIAIIKALENIEFKSVEGLVGLIMQVTDLTEKELFGKQHRYIYSKPRQAIRYLMREKFRMSYDQIGKLTGAKDHGTAMDSFRVMREALECYGEKIPSLEIDPELIREYASILPKEITSMPKEINIDLPRRKTTVVYYTGISQRNKVIRYSHTATL